MKFLNSDRAIALRDIESVEDAFQIKFPLAIRDLYLLTNGGTPDPYVFENDDVDTVVTEFLPLKSDRKRTSVDSYRSLVLGKRIVPHNFFPFAVDGGGDYFFIDFLSFEATVHFYASERSADERLLNLDVGFAAFWASLKGEDD